MRQLYPVAGEVDGPEALEELYLLPPGKHLRVVFITSIDGAVELDGRSGSLGGPADRQVFQALRAVSDAVVVGAGTASKENYGPLRLSAGASERRRSRGQPPLPRLVVVSARGAVDRSARWWSSEPPPLVVTTSTGAAALDGAAGEVVVCGEHQVDLVEAVEQMAARELQRVACEGGPHLFRDLLDEGLVDELCLTISPVLAGAGHLHLLGSKPLGPAQRFSLAGLLEGDGMLIARFSVPRNRCVRP
jgi:riboflavin biosynthesis pyrimidine reductase